jgi:hypothetical protein
MSRLRNVHWLAPTTMSLTLLSGFSLAFGHHLFYKSFDRKSVLTGSYTFAGREVIEAAIQYIYGHGTRFPRLIALYGIHRFDIETIL